jgi:hypothetical protein
MVAACGDDIAARGLIHRSLRSRPPPRSDLQRLLDTFVATAVLQLGVVVLQHHYVVAGLLIERVTGISVARRLERRFIRPLGLRHTWTRFYGALFDGRLLPCRLLAEMLTPVDTGAPAPPGPDPARPQRSVSGSLPGCAPTW